MSAPRIVAIAAAVAVGAYAATSAGTLPTRSGTPQVDGRSAPGPDSAAVARLLGALTTTDRLVCELVADQLGNYWFGADRGGFGAFADRGPQLRAAKDTLRGRVRDARAIAFLTAQLGADDPCARRVAAKMLGRSAVATDRLTALLDDGNPRVREAAAYAIGAGARGEAHRALEARLAAPDTVLAAMAAWALSEVHDSAAVGPLLRAARSPVALVRLGAIHALGDMDNNEDALPELERAARDPDARVREVAIHGIGAIGSPRSVGTLVTALSDAEPLVRYAAADALGDLDELHAAPEALVRAAHAPDPELVRRAVYALAEIADPATTDQMIGLIDHRSKEVRLHVVEALGRIGSSRAASALVRALADADPEVRRAAAEALGDIRDAG